MLAAPSTVAIETGVANHNQRRPSLRQHMDWLGERSQENQESRERRRGGRTETPIEAGDAGKLKAATRASTVVPGKKIPTAKGWDFDRWWNRGESNPRPQAIAGRFYMRSCLIWI